MPTRTEAIARFLQAKTHSDLASLYSPNMECQVNVAQDGGERVEGEYMGRKWHGWTDGISMWKPFRIPYKAHSTPEYTDKEIKFDLEVHAEGIGMTGWDWKNRCSKWVAFDFDAITGHSDKHKNKLTNEELEEVKRAAYNIDWLTIRSSTSGSGLHIYVFLDDVPTANHNEHAALARAILGSLSALTGFDFQVKVDACGGNMWVWHRKMINTDGLKLIKQGGVLEQIPSNWRDHIKVVTGKRRKNLPQMIEESGKADLFEELTGQRQKVPLDSEHKRLINYLKENELLWWWDQDHHMLVTHVHHLKLAHEALGFKGFYDTLSQGENPHEQNVFAFPLRKGAWTLRRYTPGVQEHESWEQDGAGWTRCFYNREPDLKTACRAFGGVEDPSGGFVFREAEIAIKAAQLLGVVINLSPAYLGREAILKQHKDGRLIVQVKRENMDRGDEMNGWLAKGNKPWTRIFNAQLNPAEPEVGNYDDVVRHIITEQNESYGWVVKADGKWNDNPLSHVRVALASLGLNNNEITGILGGAIFKSWKLVNKPFMPEYPGDREWNRNAAQLKYVPSENRDGLHYPTWLKILNHCGSGLDSAIKEDPWCRASGIVTGADYLKCWLAALFQNPSEPLPYLFFYGPQNSGKSIFHEAISTLLTRGYRRADAAITSSSGFNAELESALVCVIEETNLKKDKTAYNRIKDWVTSREILIHRKGETPYHTPNTTHWIQAANDFQACPVFSGDTRITMCYVQSLDPLDMVPKRRLLPMLEKEAPDFLSAILNLELPESNDRLLIPTITTQDKISIQRLNQSQLEMFIEEKCEHIDGRMIKFSTFYDRFIEWLEPNEIQYWSKIRVGRELPPQFTKGRSHKDAQHYIGNIWWSDIKPTEPKTGKLVNINGFLEVEK